jgi:hypothetical protein
MNTTARIETTGSPNKIHMSKEAAEQLKHDGKAHWVVPREESVEAKGKGTCIVARSTCHDYRICVNLLFFNLFILFRVCTGRLETFWLELRQEATYDHSTSASSTVSSNSDEKITRLDRAPSEIGLQSGGLSEKTQRLITWNTDVLTRLLVQIVGRRRGIAIQNENSGEFHAHFEEPVFHESGNTVLDEVAEIIHLPAFQGTAQFDEKSVDLGEDVMSQLQEYITIVASLYRDNPFVSDIVVV